MVKRKSYRHETIADKLAKDIAASKKSSLPGIVSLSQHYNVAYMTIWRAVRLLADQGIIEIRQGRRIRVLSKRLSSHDEIRTIRESVYNVYVHIRDAIGRTRDPDPSSIKIIELLDRLIASAIDKPVLLQNYPNPCNPNTWIPYQLSEASEVSITIHDATGRLVRRLELGFKQRGFYVDKDKAAYWDGRSEAGEHVANGIYFYTIKAGDSVQARKLTVLR